MAKEAYELARKLLETDLKLDMHPLIVKDGEKHKTRILNYQSGFTFLGVRFEGSKRLPAHSAITALKTRITELCQPEKSGLTLGRTLIKLDEVVKGWCQSYWFCHAKPDDYQILDNHLQVSVTNLLRRFELGSKGELLGRNHLHRLGVATFRSARDQILAKRSRTT